ncbi:neurogenic locus notch homolog protein 1, partial [Elysia marginata]
MFNGKAVNRPKKCKRLRYGAKCQQRCRCDYRRTASCDRTTGNCLCKPGYTGSRCNRDVDECSRNKGLCQQRFQYCRNIPGSYQCACQNGYTQRRKKGKCYPCAGNTGGAGCEDSCNCNEENTASCTAEKGICVCKQGWEGKRCERSVDDCVGNPCQDQPCRDEHRSYVCKCPHGQFYVKGLCKSVHIAMTTSDPHPRLGERLEVYMLYSLPPDYLRQPRQLPDIKHQLYVDDTPYCEMSFHAFHTRASGHEVFIKKYNQQTGQNYHFNFYSIYLIAMENATLTTLRAVPASTEFKELSLIVDLRPRVDLVNLCLLNMRVSNTSHCPKLEAKCRYRENIPNIMRQ